MEDSQRKHAGSKGFRALENRKQDIAYNHYLNSFVKLEDRRYLPNDNVIHQLVPLRAAVGTIVMTPTQFNEVHFSPLGTCFYFSENNVPNDPLTMALLEREKLNATKTISCIYS
uniref:AT21373p n=1 Tax=Drosophila melanogaster TaxID=7227 RepID=Q8MZA0_DROME